MRLELALFALLFIAHEFCLLLGAVFLSVLLFGCVTTNQVDIYHGVTVADPYRWLEDDNSAATKARVEAQNKVTFDYLATIPERAAIKAWLTEFGTSCVTSMLPA